MAHSYGGVVTVELAQQFLKDFKQRVVSVMFTDSVHHLFKGKEGRHISAIVKSFIKFLCLDLIFVLVYLNVFEFCKNNMITRFFNLKMFSHVIFLRS